MTIHVMFWVNEKSSDWELIFIHFYIESYVKKSLKILKG